MAKSRRTIKCKRCGKTRPHEAKEMCAPCYKRTRYENNREELITKQKARDALRKDDKAAYMRQYVKDNAEKIRAYQSVYQKEWCENNREKSRAYTRKWREKNRNNENFRRRRREQARAYRMAFPGKFYATIKKWKAKHPEKVLAMNAAYRARKHAAEINDFTVRDWAVMKDLWRHRCAYCGKKKKRLTQDHVTPLTKGGNHTSSNIVPACRSCNSSKGDRDGWEPRWELMGE